MPSGDAAVHVVPAAARARSVQITTSWLPGVPYVPVAVKPLPAAASAVTPVAVVLPLPLRATGGAGSSVSVQVVPPFAETAANGTRWPAAVTPMPVAATVVPLAATKSSCAVAAPAGCGTVTRDQVRPVGDSQAAARVPAEPTATNPLPVAVTAFSWLLPVAGSAMAARCQFVPLGAFQAAATVRPPVSWCPTMTYPAGPAAVAAVTSPCP